MAFEGKNPVKESVIFNNKAAAGVPNPPSGKVRIIQRNGSVIFQDDTGAETGFVSASSDFGTDNRILRSDGTGKGAQSSGVTIADSGDMSTGNDLTVTDTLFADQSAAKVGFGTTTLPARVTVKSPGQGEEGINLIRASNTTNILSLRESSGGDAIGEFKDNTGAIKVRFHSAAASFFTGGNLGINETSPDKLLHVTLNTGGAITGLQGSTALVLEAGAADNSECYQHMIAGDLSASGIFFGKRGSADSHGALLYSNTDEKMSFRTAGVTRLQMDAGLINFPTSTKIGINQPNPQAQLDIVAPDSGAIKMKGTNAEVWNMGVQNTGNLLISSATFGIVMSLDEAGDVFPGGDNNQKFGIGTNRWSEIFAGNSTINTSDERLKTKIKPLSSCLSKVNALTPSTWESKYEDYSVGTMGLVAQDLEKQFPELVEARDFKVHDVENVKVIRASGPEMAAILIKAIQELSAENEELKTYKIQATDQLATLSARLDNLEKKFG